MAKEIERKFLVKGDAWREGAAGTAYRQGYLNSDKTRTVRVRTVGERAFLTVKGLTTGVTRAEFEYEIPVGDAVTMLATLAEQPVIEKVRYKIPFEGHVWEIDEFGGENAGLIVAEVELTSEEETFVRPAWLGDEVSSDPRYFNSSLIKHPYRHWK